MTVYLDTSSAIKLYVAEQGSELVRALVAAADVVATSVVTYAEARAALARLRRDGALDAKQHRSAKQEFEAQWPRFVKITANDTLCRNAGEYAEQYALRGFDSVHHEAR